MAGSPGRLWAVPQGLAVCANLLPGPDCPGAEVLPASLPYTAHTLHGVPPGL